MRFLGVIMLIGMFAMPWQVHAENPFELIKQRAAKQEPPVGFVLRYVSPKKPVSKDIETIFKHSGKFESIIDTLNQEFRMPGSVIIKFADGAGPLYDPGKKQIRMSYDFIFYLTTLFIERYPKASDDEMLDFASRSTTFLLYHEIGHAFIDMYQIPMVSNEETAADNLAVILALEYNKDGFTIVMDSAELFDLLDLDKSKYEENDYWDEHALDAQRFYNILCMAYGKYPDRVMNELKRIKNKKLFEFVRERGDYCKYQYDQQLSAWAQMLGPYMK